MHEVSIVTDMVNIIKENAELHNLKRITKVLMKIGEMTCVEESSIRFAFEAITRDTAAEGAVLEIEKVKATAKCPNCGNIYEVSYFNKLCTNCGSYSSEIITGYELSLEHLEGE
jgi:hydrogenase nickel incorporation protein HypA/HybF